MNTLSDIRYGLALAAVLSVVPCQGDRPLENTPSCEEIEQGLATLPDDIPMEITEWRRRVLQRIRSLDSVLVVENRSRGVNNEVTIGILTEREGTEMAVKEAGYYDGESICLRSNEAGIEASVHEVAHALLDVVERKGLIDRDGYQGPNFQAISNYLRERVAGREFSFVKEEIELRKQANILFDELKTATEDSERVLIRLLQVFNPLLGQEDAIERLSESDKKRCKEKTDLIYQIAISEEKNHKVFRCEIQGTLRAWIAKREGREQITKEDVDILRDTLEKAQRRCGKLQKTLKKLKELLQDVQSIIESENPESWQGENYDETSQSFEKLNNRLRKIAIEQQFAKILGNPDEVFARMITSLYELHFGQYEQNVFPLQEEDLQFLERFEWNGGKIFAKGIEKYRLGQVMIQNGTSIEEVQKLLRFATEFEYQGKKYQWPNAKIDLSQEIVECQDSAENEQ